MDYGHSERPSGAAALPTAIKILVAGGFGVGKTTMVGAVSETRPLRTEEVLTESGVGIDDLSGVETKQTTTVAMDFGRITISDDLVLYLFGTPGQDRFWFVWDELALGAIGAVVLADTRRLADCFPSIDYFEGRGTPFLVAVNCFEGARQYRLDEVQAALNLDPEVPVLLCDARNRESAKEVLITLVEHAMKVRDARRRAE
ncbi:GTP-binding protein [Micromonospora endophytica]|uniref:ATP-binding protein n=1 Tax=Micromonospora endophytica TaxID=515350 RepID=A0A2W2C1L9_9ACTN|nr:ATP/GTP-binding protein [Micromonospora endophytica]PZF93515.1 ATP-binding protein [Micromonospora endophytica]RIW40651.1 ATP-binding protein [Micromonospora endophytica]BCJ61373.1 ATP-binding protein [Micromonospora endophytica]